MIIFKRMLYYPLASLAWLLGAFFRFPRRPQSPAGFSVVSCGLRSAEAREMFAQHSWIPYCFQRTRIPGAATGRVFLIRLTADERAAVGGLR